MEIKHSVQISQAIILLSVFADPVSGYESAWLIGDEFLTKAEGYLFGDKHIKENIAPFLWENFNVKVFADNTLSPYSSMLSRVRNQLIRAINKETLLPKIIIVILDDNLSERIKSNISFVYGSIMHWLADQFNKIIECHKDKLPQKAVKADYPHFIWIAPPVNISFDNSDIRLKLDKSLKDTLDVQKSHMMLRLKKVWVQNDRSYCRHHQVTQIGFESYWASIDSAITFWNTHLAPKGSLLPWKENTDLKGKMMSTPQYRKKHFGENRRDRFHWHNQKNQFCNRY